jgi:uncharacterized protein
MADVNTGEQVKDIVFKYAEILKNEFTIRCLYLYGSYARGDFNRDSDIDVAVVADNLSGDLVDDTFKLMKYRRMVDIRIEPHPFLPAEFQVNNPIAREIMETGIRII